MAACQSEIWKRELVKVSDNPSHVPFPQVMKVPHPSPSASVCFGEKHSGLSVPSAHSEQKMSCSVEPEPGG